MQKGKSKLSPQSSRTVIINQQLISQQISRQISIGLMTKPMYK